MASRGRPRIVEEVLHRLLRSLAGEAWPAGSTIPPSRRLAAMFGVSPGTIRQVLAEASRLGLLDVRQRRPVVVREGAAQRAEQLATHASAWQKAKRVVVLLPEQFFPLKRNTVYGLLTAALTHELSRQGLQGTVTRWPLAERIAMVRSLPHKGVDAAVVIGSSAAHVSSLCLMHEQGFPFVAFNRHIPGLSLPTVSINSEQVATDLAGRLLTLGHRNLCLVAGVTGTSTRGASPNEMALSWLNFLHEREVLDECWLPTYFAYSRDREAFAPAFVDLMHMPNRPTALVFEHYQWAAAFLRDPRFADLQVPEQVSLAMMGPTRRVPSVPWCPPLTSADINYERAAQCLVELLKRILAGETNAPSIRLPLTITITESIGRAPGA